MWNCETTREMQSVQRVGFENLAHLQSKLEETSEHLYACKLGDFQSDQKYSEFCRPPNGTHHLTTDPGATMCHPGCHPASKWRTLQSPPCRCRPSRFRASSVPNDSEARPKDLRPSRCHGSPAPRVDSGVWNRKKTKVFFLDSDSEWWHITTWLLFDCYLITIDIAILSIHLRLEKFRWSDLHVCWVCCLVQLCIQDSGPGRTWRKRRKREINCGGVW